MHNFFLLYISLIFSYVLWKIFTYIFFYITTYQLHTFFHSFKIYCHFKINFRNELKLLLHYNLLIAILSCLPGSQCSLSTNAIRTYVNICMYLLLDFNITPSRWWLPSASFRHGSYNTYTGIWLQYSPDYRWNDYAFFRCIKYCAILSSGNHTLDNNLRRYQLKNFKFLKCRFQISSFYLWIFALWNV